MELEGLLGTDCGLRDGFRLDSDCLVKGCKGETPSSGQKVDDWFDERGGGVVNSSLTAAGEYRGGRGHECGVLASARGSGVMRVRDCRITAGVSRRDDGGTGVDGDINNGVISIREQVRPSRKCLSTSEEVRSGWCDFGCGCEYDWAS